MKPGIEPVPEHPVHATGVDLDAGEYFFLGLDVGTENQFVRMVFQERFNTFLVRFHMKLEGHDVILVKKPLVWASVGFGDPEAHRRNSECFLMPVEGHPGIGEILEQGKASRRWSKPDPMPSDLFVWIFIYRSTQNTSNKLGAETNAENFFPFFDCFFQEFHFLYEKRMPPDVVGGHRSSEYDQKIEILKLREVIRII